MKFHTQLLALACALLALPLVVAAAGPGKGGIGLGGAGGGDDIGSLPSTMGDPPSLLLVGTAQELDAAILRVWGPGEVYVHRLVAGDDRLVLEFEGSLHVQIAAGALADGSVTAWLHAGTTFAETLGVDVLRELPLPALVGGAKVQVSNRLGQTYGLASRVTGDGVLHVRQVLR